VNRYEIDQKYIWGCRYVPFNSKAKYKVDFLYIQFNPHISSYTSTSAYNHTPPFSAFTATYGAPTRFSSFISRGLTYNGIVASR
jgi:hypothetical protein